MLHQHEAVWRRLQKNPDVFFAEEETLDQGLRSMAITISTPLMNANRANSKEQSAMLLAA
jgi:hypothetical protein